MGIGFKQVQESKFLIPFELDKINTAAVILKNCSKLNVYDKDKGLRAYETTWSQVN